MIEERDKSLLRDLARIAARQGVEFYVIGAGARLLTHDWPHVLSGGRGTTDWDVAVHVASWQEFERLRRILTSADAPFRPTDADHRLRHTGGLALDIVPFGGVEAGDRTITYPRGETRHSTLGLRECEAFCRGVPIDDGVLVRVVEPPGLVVLKASAYFERRPVKTRDVQDIDFMARTYGRAVDGDHIEEQAGEALRKEAVPYEDVGAYLLARDVSGLPLPPNVLKPLRRLLEELTDPSSQAVSDLVQFTANDQEAQRAAITRRYAAFQLGLSG